MVGTIKISSSGGALNIKRFRYSSPRFIAQRGFFYVGKDVKIKYASSNFSLYVPHMEQRFPLFSNLL